MLPVAVLDHYQVAPIKLLLQHHYRLMELIPPQILLGLLKDIYYTKQLFLLQHGLEFILTQRQEQQILVAEERKLAIQQLLV